MKEILVGIGAIMAVVGNVPYLRDVLRGKVQPHAYTWMAWSVVSAIVLIGQVVKGAGLGAIPAAASEFFTFIIFLVSLKYGFKNIKPVDHIFLILSLLSIIPWLITKDPTISVIIAVSIDLIAFVPTLRKTWENPASETPWLYGMNVLRHIIILYTVAQFNIATTLHSIVMIGSNSLMSAFLLYHIYLKQDKR